MLISDIIKQIRAVIPGETDFFSEKTVISTLTNSGTTATATTSGAHGLSVGNEINIFGSLTKTPIATLSQVGGVATLTTTPFHDVTFGNPNYETITIEGANEAQYNGTHTLLSVSTTNTLTFTIDSGAPATATGTMFLLEDRTGYNGRFTIVTVPTPSSFTYTMNDTPSGYANISSAFIYKGVRISGSVDIERALESYTAKDVDKMWAFVVYDGSIANNNRNNSNDANYLYEKGVDYRQEVIEGFSVYVFAPSHEAISARPQVDNMVAIRNALFKSLLGVRFETGFEEATNYGMTFLADGTELYNGPVYVHRFQFQVVENVRSCDIVENKNTKAWRTFEIDAYTGFESYTEKKDIDGKLPESE